MKREKEREYLAYIVLEGKIIISNGGFQVDVSGVDQDKVEVDPDRDYQSVYVPPGVLEYEGSFELGFRVRVKAKNREEAKQRALQIMEGLNLGDMVSIDVPIDGLDVSLKDLSFYVEDVEELG